MQQESDPTLAEEKAIYALLEKEYQAYQKEKPSAQGLRRWTRFSRSHIQRLDQLSQLRHKRSLYSVLNAPDSPCEPQNGDYSNETVKDDKG